MTNEQIAALIAEIREDFQIPPYYEDSVIRRAVLKCMARLSDLREDADFVADHISRGLLGNYVYYALNHRDEEFMQCYGPDIRSWQLSAEAREADEPDEDTGNA